VILEFSGEIIYWRGPAPFHFVAVPEEQSAAIQAVASSVTYGWGAIPVKARVGRTDSRTSLFPKRELYLVPIKNAVRKAEGLELGDHVTVRLELDAYAGRRNTCRWLWHCRGPRLKSHVSVSGIQC
jgi:hypothetical protein